MSRGKALASALVALAGVAALVAVASAPAGPDRGSGPWTLVVDERFDGPRLDRSLWRTCHWWARRGCTIAGNHELEWYLPRQVRVRKGVLRLVADRRRAVGEGGRVHRFVSGMVSSGPGPEREAGFAFRYGRAEMRARLPAGDPLWPAFWLLPVDRRPLPEIDVMEVTGDEPNVVDMHLHHRDREGNERAPGHEWAGLRPGWHRFAIEWRPRLLRWLVDGEVRWTLRGARVPDEPMYLIANLAVRSDRPNRDTAFPAVLEIDRIRVWR
jgi:beta-glucanase (GH16 family)